MNRYSNRLDLLTLVWQLFLENDNSEFKPFKFCLKIGLVSQHARTESLVKNVYTLTYLHFLYSELWLLCEGLKDE